MGVAEEFLGLAAFPWRSKQWTPLIVDAMQQDGQEQAVVYVVEVEQRGPGRLSQPHGGMESLAPRPRVDVAIRLVGMDRREPKWRGVMSLWRSATAEIAANSGVPPWLNASASMASSGQIQSGGLIDTGPATIAAT